MLDKQEIFTLRLAAPEDAETIAENMRSVYEALDNKELFVCDDAAYIARHISQEGFTVVVCNDSGKIVGELTVHYPGMGEENLGRDAGLDMEELGRVCHMESASVLKDYRGHGLQEQMLRYAEACVDKEQYTILMATVSPDNPASYHSVEKLGYHMVVTKEKYGGLRRRIYMKIL